MKWLALIAVVFATVSAANAAPARHVSEQEFAKVIMRCWGAEWRAYFVDGGEESGLDTVCFDDNGRVSTTSAMFGEAGGRYWLADEKLYVQADEASRGWVLGAVRMNCDVAIRPNEGITLSGCRGNNLLSNGTIEPIRELGDLSFDAVREQDE